MTTPDAALGPAFYIAGWSARAEREMQRVHRALGTACHKIHHVGSTSVVGLVAVPVVDLMAELNDVNMHDVARLRLLTHGYAAAPGPSHCTAFVAEDALTGCRTVELLLYPCGHEDVRISVAFFAVLRAWPDVAVAYGTLKLQARARHGADASGYAAEKRAWMRDHARLSHDLPLYPAG